MSQDKVRIITSEAEYIRGQVTSYLYHTAIAAATQEKIKKNNDKAAVLTKAELRELYDTQIRKKQQEFDLTVKAVDVTGNVARNQDKISGLNVFAAIDLYFDRDVPDKLGDYLNGIKTQLLRINDLCRNKCTDKSMCEKCNPMDKLKKT